jgi:hypothetical protein
MTHLIRLHHTLAELNIQHTIQNNVVMILSESTIHPSFPGGEKYGCLSAGNEFPIQHLGLGIYSSGNLSLTHVRHGGNGDDQQTVKS